MNKKIFSIALLIVLLSSLAIFASACTSTASEQIGDAHQYGRGAAKGDLDSQSAALNGDERQSIANSQGRGGGNGQSRGSGAGTGNAGSGNGGMNATAELSQAEADALIRAIEEEYGALALYESIIATFGEVEPFTDIVQSEAQHAAVLVRQAEKYGLEVPAYTPADDLPTFDTLEAACQAGVEAEIADAALYDELMALTDRPDLLRVFTNLQRASLENHLPAFQDCQ